MKNTIIINTTINNNEDIVFNPDGSTDLYKTNFAKELFPEMKLDLDTVIVHKPTKKSTMAACNDYDGHICEVCLEFSHKFIEIKSPMVLPIKICDNCLTIAKELIDKI